MLLWMVCGYLAMAALFYAGLAATATAVPPRSRPSQPTKWQRVRHFKRNMKESGLRRLRPMLALRLPKRTR